MSLSSFSSSRHVFRSWRCAASSLFIFDISSDSLPYPIHPLPIAPGGERCIFSYLGLLSLFPLSLQTSKIYWRSASLLHRNKRAQKNTLLTRKMSDADSEYIILSRSNDKDVNPKANSNTSEPWSNCSGVWVLAATCVALLVTLWIVWFRKTPLQRQPAQLKPHAPQQQPAHRLPVKAPQQERARVTGIDGVLLPAAGERNEHVTPALLRDPTSRDVCFPGKLQPATTQTKSQLTPMPIMCS